MKGPFFLAPPFPWFPVLSGSLVLSGSVFRPLGTTVSVGLPVPAPLSGAMVVGERKETIGVLPISLGPQPLWSERKSPLLRMLGLCRPWLLLLLLFYCLFCCHHGITSGLVQERAEKRRTPGNFSIFFFFFTLGVPLSSPEARARGLLLDLSFSLASNQLQISKCLETRLGHQKKKEGNSLLAWWYLIF